MRSVASRRGRAERVGGGAHRVARARRVVEPVVVDVGELEQRVAALARAGDELGERARGGARPPRNRRARSRARPSSRSTLGVAGRDVVRGLERRERIVELAGGARARRGVAQRQRAGRARLSTRPLGVFSSRSSARPASRSGASPRSRASAGRRRRRRLERARARAPAARRRATASSWRVVEPERRARRARAPRPGARAPRSRDRAPLSPGELAGELREAAGRGDDRAVVARAASVT